MNKNEIIEKVAQVWGIYGGDDIEFDCSVNEIRDKIEEIQKLEYLKKKIDKINSTINFLEANNEEEGK